MKKILMIIAVVAAMMAATPARAYNAEMAQIAQMLGAAGAEEGFAVQYDGAKDNLIFVFPESFLGDDAKELANAVNLNDYKPQILAAMGEAMGADNLKMFAEMLKAYNTNLVIRMAIGGKNLDLTIKPSDISGK